MEKFNLKKITTQLNKVNKDNGKDINAGIQLIINNMEIYNSLLADYALGNSKQDYILYQMSYTIFKQLNSYNIFPNKEDNTSTSKEDSFTLMKKKICKN